MTVIGIASPMAPAQQPKPAPQPQFAPQQPPQPQFAPQQPPQQQYPQQYAQQPPQYHPNQIQQQPAQPAAPNPEDEPKFARASHPGFAPAPPPPQQSPPSAKKMLNQTMVGVGSLPGAQNANAPAAQPPRGAQNIPKGTLVGVAVPGVAPTHEPRPQPVLGQQQPFQPAPHFQAPPPFQPPQQPYVPQSAPYESLPPPPKPSRAPAIILALVALVGVIAALVYVFVLRPSAPPPLTSAVEGDWNAPTLVVKCETCADGSSIDLGGKSAIFAGGTASIALASNDIQTGANSFKGKLVPKGKSPRDVELKVLVPYRVRTSLAPLAKGEPHIDVVFDLADTVKSVTVDGETLTGTGEKKHAVKIPDGAADARAFDKTVNYEVHPKEGAPIKGSVKIAIPYAPLRLGLPGRRAFAIGGELEVSGHTSNGGTITVGEQTLTADDAGIFKGKVKVEGDAKELSVRAFSGKLAARTLTVPIAHAKDAAEIAKTLKAEAKTPFAKIAEKPEEHLGAAVDVKIVVAQTKEEDGRTVAVGDQKCGGDACPVVRVLLPPGATVNKGDVLEVLGVVARGVPMASSTAVEIDASVLVSTK